VVLTAGHCVDAAGGSASNLMVNGIKAKKFKAHPKWAKGAVDKAGFDVALVAFKQDLPGTPMGLASKTPSVGDAVTVIGYGMSMPGAVNTVNVRRMGTNTVAQTDMGQIIVNREQYSSQPIPLPGDSGSPLVDSESHVTGVCSQYLGPPAMSYYMAAYIDINDPEVRSGLREMAKDLGVSAPF
jgi:V8-like Glu-specific endopeptidase